MCLKLGIFAHRLHHLTDRIDDNIGPVYDDEMPALLRNDLLAVLRKRQQFSLQLGGTRTVNRRDIDERLVAERVAVFSGDRVRLRNTFRHQFMVCLHSLLISGLRHRPKMKLAVPG